MRTIRRIQKQTPRVGLHADKVPQKVFVGLKVQCGLVTILWLLLCGCILFLSGGKRSLLYDVGLLECAHYKHAKALTDSIEQLT